MTSLEQRLAAVLQAEVDKAVEQVQRAALEAVQAFQELAGRIARGEAQSAPASPAARPEAPPPAAPVVADDEPAPMPLPPGAEQFMVGIRVTDQAALASNMSVR
jgi:hypothetical protein